MMPDVEEIKTLIDRRAALEALLGCHLPDKDRSMIQCIFHEDKTPSMLVDVQKARAYCFGCNKGGDIFTLAMEIYNETFPEAKARLAQMAGLTPHKGPIPASQRAEIAHKINQQKKKKEAIATFRQWEIDLSSLCGEIIFEVRRRFLAGYKEMSEAEEDAVLFHLLSFTEHVLDILTSGDDEAKSELYLKMIRNG